MRLKLFPILLAALLLAGCAPKESGGTAQSPPPAAGGGTVTEFRLGEGAMEESRGTVTFPLDGLVGVPEGEGRPVVFVLHGAHGVEDVAEDRYYLGFSYLVQALADRGYLAVAVNLNRAFSVEPFEGVEYQRAMEIFQGYYDLLQRANGGERLFDADLTGKADLTRLNFIGHSRGGDNSLYIAKTLGEHVSSVLLVASPLMLTPETIYSDLPTGVVLAQYDGDVTGLETAALFNRAWFLDGGRTAPVSMAFLYGANHAQFSATLPQADTLAPPQGVTYLEGAVQRDFLARYAGDFLDAMNGAGDPAALLGEQAPARYGIDFMASVYLPGGQRLTPGAGAQAAVLSQVPMENTIAPFNHPGPLEENVTLWRWGWDAAGETLSLEGAAGDWSKRTALDILMANNPAEARGSADLALEVVLTDGDGKTATVALDAKDTGALRYLPTEVEDLFAGLEGLEPYLMAKFHTPLGLVSLELGAFQGVDLSRVQSVVLRGVSGRGAVVLGGAQVR